MHMIALRCRRGSPHQGATRRLPEDRTFFKSATALRFKLFGDHRIPARNRTDRVINCGEVGNREGARCDLLRYGDCKLRSNSGTEATRAHIRRSNAKPIPAGANIFPGRLRDTAP